VARADIQPTEEFVDDDLHDLKWTAFYAVGKHALGKGRKKLKGKDVSVFVLPLGGKPISDFEFEITVTLDEGEWLKTKKAYNRLARKIRRRVASEIERGDGFFIWVVGGPHRGYCEGRGLLVKA